MMIDGIKPPRRPGQRPAQPAPTTPPEPTFTPPEIVAAQEETSTADMPSWQRANVKKQGSKKPFRLTKKQGIIAGVVAAVLLIAAGAVFVLTRPKPKPLVLAPAPPPPQKTETPPAPTTVASPLTGLQVQPDQAKLPVTGVMIENSPDARPQSGLKDAGVVFEAIAEGGITRFLALYQEAQPDYVGPVRSARPYYLQWLQGFDASVAHVGGSPEALQYIKTAGVKDLDQFYNSGPYHRISTRYAPHNMYTSIPKLLDLEKSKGFTSSTFTGFVRKGKEAPNPTPLAKTIDIVISGYLYNVHYDYDAATNSYKRSEGGKPHMDERSNTQLSPKVVVVMVMPYSLEADNLHSSYAVTGSGKAFFFQDGNVTQGIWEKPDVKTNVRFGDANGSPLALNPGQTWITVVGAASNVSYKP